MTTVKNIYDYINSFAPFSTQEGWDNSGVLIGDRRAEVKKCVVALDVTKEVLDFAVKNSAQLIVSHHPVIFGSVKSVAADTVIYDAVKNDVAVVSAHTNYDVALGGINDVLAKNLELTDVMADESGFLRYGKLENSMTCEEFAKYIKEKLSCESVRFSHTDRKISTVAVCGGAGADFIDSAMTVADAYVTGDLSYHNILDASEQDYCVVAAGHFETEVAGAMALCDKLAALFTDVEFTKAPQKNSVKTV